MAWFTVASDAYRLLAGEPASFRSSDHGTRSFCPRCGTPLTFQSDLRDEIDVTSCSLLDPERVPPRDHVRTRSRLWWMRSGDGLPSYAEARH